MAQRYSKMPQSGQSKFSLFIIVIITAVVSSLVTSLVVLYASKNVLDSQPVNITTTTRDTSLDKKYDAKHFSFMYPEDWYIIPTTDPSGTFVSLSDKETNDRADEKIFIQIQSGNTKKKFDEAYNHANGVVRQDSDLVIEKLESLTIDGHRAVKTKQLVGDNKSGIKQSMQVVIESGELVYQIGLVNMNGDELEQYAPAFSEIVETFKIKQ